MRLALTLMAAVSACGQTFEVASIKHAGRGGTDMSTFITGGPGTSSPERISLSGVTVSLLIMQAYGVRSVQITGPGWIGDERFTITAKVPAGSTKADLAVMLQNLLKERFNLKFHQDTVERPVHALIPGQGGHKLKAGGTTGAPNRPAPAAIGTPDAQGYPMVGSAFRGVSVRAMNGQMFVTGQYATIPEMIYWLEQPLQLWIVDRTGLTESYDFKIDYAARPPAPGDVPDMAQSVFTAVEQLGLKLEKRNLPMPQIVVDVIDREPSAN